MNKKKTVNTTKQNFTVDYRETQKPQKNLTMEKQKLLQKK